MVDIAHSVDHNCEKSQVRDQIGRRGIVISSINTHTNVNIKYWRLVNEHEHKHDKQEWFVSKIVQVGLYSEMKLQQTDVTTLLK